jgi:hypothetical protein
LAARRHHLWCGRTKEHVYDLVGHVAIHTYFGNAQREGDTIRARLAPLSWNVIRLGHPRND